MSAFELFTAQQDALREARVRTGLNTGPGGWLAVSVKQGKSRVEIVTHRKGASGKCDVRPLTGFVTPQEATRFLQGYNG